MDAQNPYAAPQAPLEPAPAPAAPTHAEPAGFAIRAAGRVIDMIVSAAAGFAGGVMVGVVRALVKAAGVHAAAPEAASSLGAIVIAFLIGTAGNIGYHVLAEGIGGASVGKLVLGLRVRHVDLTPPRIKGALIRSVAYYFDGFFFGIVAYGAMSSSAMLQRYGDKWGDTVVVRAASLPRDPDDGLRVAIGLASGIVFEMLAVVASSFLRVT
jgi:uncharacterized RDD family membrane protein YckC